MQVQIREERARRKEHRRAKYEATTYQQQKKQGKFDLDRKALELLEEEWTLLGQISPTPTDPLYQRSSAANFSVDLHERDLYGYRHRPVIYGCTPDIPRSQIPPPGAVVWTSDPRSIYVSEEEKAALEEWNSIAVYAKPIKPCQPLKSILLQAGMKNGLQESQAACIIRSDSMSSIVSKSAPSFEMSPPITRCSSLTTMGSESTASSPNPSEHRRKAVKFPEILESAIYTIPRDQKGGLMLYLKPRPPSAAQDYRSQAHIDIASVKARGKDFPRVSPDGSPSEPAAEPLMTLHGRARSIRFQQDHVEEQTIVVAEALPGPAEMKNEPHETALTSLRQACSSIKLRKWLSRGRKTPLSRSESSSFSSLDNKPRIATRIQTHQPSQGRHEHSSNTRQSGRRDRSGLREQTAERRSAPVKRRRHYDCPCGRSQSEASRTVRRLKRRSLRKIKKLAGMFKKKERVEQDWPWFLPFNGPKPSSSLPAPWFA